MLFRLSKATPNVFSQSLRYALRPTTPSVRPFSSFLKQNEPAQAIATQPDQVSLDNIAPIHAHTNSYMKKLYQYLTAASVIGISASHLLSFAIPVGFPSAFLIIAGFGLHHVGTEYIEKTRPKSFVYKGADGNMQSGTSNPLLRKLSFLSSCLGYSCVVGSLLGMIPLAPSVLPLSFITCLFSTLGHLNYCKFAPRPYFKPKHLLLSGLFTGILGLNFLTSGSTILMLENPLHLESVEVSTYLGLLLYNSFTAHDSQKIVEDVHKGKGDYLKHANKFAENWLYSLIPHFLMNI